MTDYADAADIDMILFIQRINRMNTIQSSNQAHINSLELVFKNTAIIANAYFTNFLFIKAT
ncbi:MAG: hypothetical protein ABIR81_11705 [Ginsengibacter sp.]